MLKFSLKRDLTPERERAVVQIDRFLGEAAVSSLEAIHGLKAEMAARRDEALADEANSRGLTLDALCALILERRREQHLKVLQLDALRLALKARVALASSQQEIELIAEEARSASQAPQPGL